MTHTISPQELTAPLPMSRQEMKDLGWESLDILLVSGDAYIDHPSFGAALLGRWMTSQGFRVGIVAQPRWDSPDDILGMGRPKLFAGVTAGALDSMLAHYTAFRKKRRDDAYTPGGQHGARPNRASIVYAGLVRQAFPGLPVILGGIEASLRRASHFDFWSDKLRRSILLDSKADLVVYGMGERAILEIAERLRREEGASLQGIAGTVFAAKKAGKKAPPEATAPPTPDDVITTQLPSHEDMLTQPEKLMEATLALEQQVRNGRTWATQECGGRKVVFAPPAAPLTTAELDALYALPFTRRPHSSYGKPIPAAGMIQFSMTSHRGCGGGCSYCSLGLHQGHRIRSRSTDSLRNEVATLAKHPDWTGSVSDVGGPSANMWGAWCEKEKQDGKSFTCTRTSCLTPSLCPFFKTRQSELARLLKRLAAMPGVEHLRIASGVRHDLALQEPKYATTLMRDFVGGQLKLAPEHSCDPVLRLMRKPSFKVFEEFLTVFERESGRSGKEQYVVPYLISAFPGCTDGDMRTLADWLGKRGWRPRQVQCFIPIPGAVATAMFYAGIDSEGATIHVARSDAERLRQHGILVPSPESSRRKEAHRPQPGTPRPRNPKRVQGHGRSGKSARARKQKRRR